MSGMASLKITPIGSTSETWPEESSVTPPGEFIHALAATTDKTLSPDSFRSGGHEITLHRHGGQYVRVEVHDSAERVIGFSNAFWMLPTDHPADIPTKRKFQVQPS